MKLPILRFIKGNGRQTAESAFQTNLSALILPLTTLSGNIILVVYR